MPKALIQAYRDAAGPGGLAFATPQIALVGAIVLAYTSGLLVAGGRLGHVTPVIAGAVIAALVSALVGISLAWGTRALPAPRAVVQTGWLPVVGAALLAIGLGAMVLYFIRIGEIPLFMSSVEQGRVDAAERGGAALRVLSLLALPACWLLVAAAVASRRWSLALGASAAVLLFALLQILTANRSHAFQVVIVSVIIALLAGGRQRLGARGIVALGAIAVVMVVAAGGIGAVRLSSAELIGPPAPSQHELRGRPPDYPALTLIAIRGYAIVPAQNLAYTMEAVPAVIGWRLGSTYLQPILTILPGKQVTFDQDLKVALGQRYEGGGTVPSLLGEAFANFGPAGWVLVPAILGAVLAVLYRHAARRQAPALWALYGYTIYHLATATLSGLFVASIFPYEAYAILGGAAILEARSHRSDPAPDRRVA